MHWCSPLSKIMHVPWFPPSGMFFQVQSVSSQQGLVQYGSPEPVSVQ